MFTTSEKKIIKKIRTFIKGYTETYNFWFIYDNDDNAIDFAGGSELGKFAGFRNDYYIEPGRYQKVMRTPLN